MTATSLDVVARKEPLPANCMRKRVDALRGEQVVADAVRAAARSMVGATS